MSANSDKCKSVKKMSHVVEALINVMYIYGKGIKTENVFELMNDNSVYMASLSNCKGWFIFIFTAGTGENKLSCYPAPHTILSNSLRAPLLVIQNLKCNSYILSLLLILDL